MMKIGASQGLNLWAAGYGRQNPGDLFCPVAEMVKYGDKAVRVLWAGCSGHKKNLGLKTGVDA